MSSVLDSDRVLQEPQRKRIRRPITAIEAAEAAAFADVAAAICVLSRVLPIAGAAILVSSIPFALLGARRRLRVGLLAGATGWIVALLFGGYGTANMVGSAAVMGIFCGIAIRRRWSAPTTFGVSIVALGIPAAVLFTGLLAVFSTYREFMFDQIRNGVGGTARILSNAGFTDVQSLDRAVTAALRVWPITISVGTLLGVVLAAMATAVVVRAPVVSLMKRLGEPVTDSVGEETGLIAPVPVSLRDVSVTHPGAITPTISGINADIGVGGLVSVTGRNGAGKSTLAGVISGRRPTMGSVFRRGNPGLGAPGGTAVIGQRPETSVLGLQVGDDLAWGDPHLTPQQATGLLERVGLNVGLDAETARLSGGQLQRLAIAGALARDPQLLVSDESTAMVDKSGRDELMGVYRGLADAGTTIVHITHDADEIEKSDHTIAVPGGDTATHEAPASARGRMAAGGGRIDVHGLRFAHDSGTPWHRDVLAQVDLTIAAGQTVLITGANGAGKSTLARLLAGIERPDEGVVLLDGVPVQNNRTGALFGHQYARLSLVRARVRDDIADAAGLISSTNPVIAESLREMGLDRSIADQRVDNLSVGQQRRVALAGLLAARPRVLVLDEPLAGLDEPSRVAMVTALARVRASGTTLIVVTHDVDELTPIADRLLEVPQIVPGPVRLARSSRASLAGVVGRVLPGTSPAKRLWVGSKVFAIAALALMFGINPTWVSVAAAVIIAVAWTAAGRIPVAALPRLPWWIFLVMLGGGFVTAMGGGKPFVTVAGVELGLGGASTWAILISITIISFYVSLLFCWTTPMVEVPAFSQRLVGYAAKIGVPAQSVAVSVTVALRLLPFMIGDFRVLLQTVAQRRAPGQRSVRDRAEQWSACMPIACALAAQNAREVAASMDNRGGIGSVSRPDRRPGLLDVAVIAGIVAIVTAALVLG
ncbi:ATP-binding cassette domain-containing protein [Williamsia maris]|uniref:Energy-coupling factor transport system ATP-binding protein n=1 Tax=Williamsia maris TaxID=72806 RepID=A0ABT1HD33_9NOCA|nr:ATP-binding cassette domain-containing protein [Williamsia maris]MCP2175832.1 energy-coupling factor transport system ATP-binding protein [Williamsia maris]